MATLMTGKQGKKLLEVFEGTDSRQVQAVLGSGLLSLLRDANITQIDYEEFRRVCGFKPKISSSFEVWYKLTIGGISEDELLRDALGHFFRSPSLAEDIMTQPEFTVLSEPTEIQLALVSLKDIGFTKSPTTGQIFDRIKEIGNLCPAEVGPHLCRAYKALPLDSAHHVTLSLTYTIAMEPIKDSNGNLSIFQFSKDQYGQPRLETPHVHYNRNFGGVGCKFIFML